DGQAHAGQARIAGADAFVSCAEDWLRRYRGVRRMRRRIEAIPTGFNGITYRSRAEAKWAWFFDKCRIPVQYEPEGFKTEAGWYLPDFQLMEAPRPTYFEVKPHRPTKREYDLMQALAKGAEAHVFVAHGAPSRN